MDKPNRKPFTQEEIDKIGQLLTDNISFEDIAAIMSSTIKTISHRACLLGYHKPIYWTHEKGELIDKCRFADMNYKQIQAEHFPSRSISSIGGAYKKWLEEGLPLEEDSVYDYTRWKQKQEEKAKAATASQKKKLPKSENLINTSAKARKQGLTYGQYVAQNTEYIPYP